MQRNIIFKNRTDAGIKLAMELEKYRHENPVIVAVPGGGVETGFQVAMNLDCEFDVIVARKLSFPNQPEIAFGALAEDGSLYFYPYVQKKLSREVIDIVMEREELEIKRRVKIYRKGKPFIPLKNRTVIIVDDGIATGSTLFAIVELCRKQNIDKKIVAVPVCSKEILPKLSSKVDKVVVLSISESFNAVSQAYETFPNISEEEVLRYLKKWHARTNFLKTLEQL